VLVTVCTRGRQPRLATDEVHEQLRAAWVGATGWRAGRYVILPDHLHIFAAPRDVSVRLDAWVRYWKTSFRRRLPDRSFAWQRSHWDRRIRSLEGYEGKWHYVRLNPVRAGLVARPEDWPYAGEIETLWW